MVIDIFLFLDFGMNHPLHLNSPSSSYGYSANNQNQRISPYGAASHSPQQIGYYDILQASPSPPTATTPTRHSPHIVNNNNNNTKVIMNGAEQQQQHTNNNNSNMDRPTVVSLSS